MKTPQEPHARRRNRRDPWSAKNIRLLRVALKVWELKKRGK